MTTNAQYEAVEAELQRQLDRLYGADATTVDAARRQLLSLAGQVDDELWRRRAIRRAEQLPKLLSGPSPATSTQYAEAQQLYAGMLASTAWGADRVAELQRAVGRLAELTETAPAMDGAAVKELSSSLVRLSQTLPPADD
jgi:ABC-type branched-subunit amino acid transport system substrate-binding protein